MQSDQDGNSKFTFNVNCHIISFLNRVKLNLCDPIDCSSGIRWVNIIISKIKITDASALLAQKVKSLYDFIYIRSRLHMDPYCFSHTYTKYVWQFKEFLKCLSVNFSHHGRIWFRGGYFFISVPYIVWLYLCGDHDI